MEQAQVFKSVELLRDEIDTLKRKAIKISTVIGLLGAILLIASILTESFGFTVVGFIVIVVALITFGAMGNSKTIVENKSKIKNKLVNWYLEDNGFENINYQEKNYLSWQTFYNQNLIQMRPDRAFGEDLIFGEYKNISFKMSDLKLQEKHETRDSKGNKRTHYVTYFSGKVIIIDYPKDIDSDLTLIDKKGMINFTKGDFTTEVIEFNETFIPFTTDTEKVFKILSPTMIQKIVSFKEMQKGRVNIAFTNDKLYITVNNNSELLNINFNEEITFENTEKYLKELLLPMAIINEFRIDSHTFN